MAAELFERPEKEASSLLQVMDNWEGQPGAAVVAPSGTASRERRLLEWANDMEALVNTQVSIYVCTQPRIYRACQRVLFL